MEVVLARWEPAFKAALVENANNPQIAKNMTNQFPHPFTGEVADKFIAHYGSMEPARIFAILVNGTPVGAIGIHPKEDIEAKNAELGYWLGEAHWGKGIMTAAIRLMVEYGFATFEINRVFARPFGSNISSQKALERAGFLLEARLKGTFYKNDQYEDELIYAIRRT
ncbi:RimJ/RimL family protein N-acetyltransferase [Chitinophaga skermanii]|uniref:RimJ/RimL family protein N-acetyltransferase n=1 Tax=Chitinophaga skermanii TaxID=331697 RepID=A0A327QRL8_9BACT|nr:GNAT family protein [Chitinophaga skermanii]RAJ06545.1 RimJ/RimL family protein N-acetyltransferase [Chitinophaga skermanii]